MDSKAALGWAAPHAIPITSFNPDLNEMTASPLFNLQNPRGAA